MLSELNVVVLSVNINLELVVSEEVLEGLDEVTDWGSNSQLEIEEGSGNLSPWGGVKLLHGALETEFGLRVGANSPRGDEKGSDQKDSGKFHCDVYCFEEFVLLIISLMVFKGF